MAEMSVINTTVALQSFPK
ncbi:hypothetical protein RDI58_019882 [Solanum bulbocastanum]|uniref:Uncharacterized protein n=1 Tax=Solanum bulbocastanum TaxID=147425 RepID=A0AAN8TB16_SOLBU